MQPSEEDGSRGIEMHWLGKMQEKTDIPAPFPDIAAAVTGASLRLHKNIDELR